MAERCQEYAVHTICRQHSKAVLCSVDSCTTVYAVVVESWSANILKVRFEKHFKIWYSWSCVETKVVFQTNVVKIRIPEEYAHIQYCDNSISKATIGVSSLWKPLIRRDQKTQEIGTPVKFNRVPHGQHRGWVKAVLRRERHKH